LSHPSPRRIFAVASAFDGGMELDEVAKLTSINPFFLGEIARVVETGRNLASSKLVDLDAARLRELKSDGFSDEGIGRRVGAPAAEVRARREALGVRPQLVQIDTLAAEYPAATNYMYLSYSAASVSIW